MGWLSYDGARSFLGPQVGELGLPPCAGGPGMDRAGEGLEVRYGQASLLVKLRLPSWEGPVCMPDSDLLLQIMNKSRGRFRALKHPRII